MVSFHGIQKEYFYDHGNEWLLKFLKILSISGWSYDTGISGSIR